MQRSVGCLYANGEGVKKSFRQSIRWFRRGALQQDKNAIAALKELGIPILRKRKQKPTVEREAAIVSSVSEVNQATSGECVVEVEPNSSDRGLWEDLKGYSGEVYSNGDASAGFKLIKEVVGLTSILLFLAQFEILLTGGRTSVAFNAAMSNLLRSYMKLGDDERRKVRAWVSVARTGFGFFKK